MEYVLASVVVALALAFVTWPLLRSSAPEVELASADATRDGSVRRREAIYQEVLELDLDHRMGKVSADEYQLLTADSLARAEALLAEDDAAETATDDRVEREIADARASLKQAGTPSMVERKSS